MNEENIDTIVLVDICVGGLDTVDTELLARCYTEGCVDRLVLKGYDFDDMARNKGRVMLELYVADVAGIVVATPRSAMLASWAGVDALVFVDNGTDKMLDQYTDKGIVVTHVAGEGGCYMTLSPSAAEALSANAPSDVAIPKYVGLPATTAICELTNHIKLRPGESMANHTYTRLAQGWLAHTTVGDMIYLRRGGVDARFSFGSPVSMVTVEKPDALAPLLLTTDLGTYVVTMGDGGFVQGMTPEKYQVPDPVAPSANFLQVYYDGHIVVKLPDGTTMFVSRGCGGVAMNRLSTTYVFTDAAGPFDLLTHCGHLCILVGDVVRIYAPDAHHTVTTHPADGAEMLVAKLSTGIAVGDGVTTQWPDAAPLCKEFAVAHLLN